MPSARSMRDRLPSLYRPEDGETGLLVSWLAALGAALDAVDRQASEVLRSHWFDAADDALYSPFFLRSRQLGDPAHFPPRPDDPARLTFPYVHDLARLAALLPLPPWQEPPSQRELVEAYRERIARTVALYRHGLGTVAALRGMVETQLPLDLTQPAERRDRGFEIEEDAPRVGLTRAIQVGGVFQAPAARAGITIFPPFTGTHLEDLVGPLMRWIVQNPGPRAAATTLLIQGVAPKDGSVDPTADPVVELWKRGPAFPRLGIAYRGTLAPGQTLRLRPAYTSWIGRADGMFQADARPSNDQSVDPAPTGPFAAAPSAPSGSIVAMFQAPDAAVWVAASGGTALWRYDGTTWTQALTALPAVHCLAGDGQDLLIGTDKGLTRLPLFPASGTLSPSPALASLNGKPVYALLRAADGWWLGNGDGAFRLGPADALQPAALQGTAVYALSQDETGTISFGAELGLFQYQPAGDAWYYYAGDSATGLAADWRPLAPASPGGSRPLPTSNQVFLPPVRVVQRGPDGSLWIGTDAGLARYVAHAIDDLTYETRLEAYPDLVDGRVFAIAVDERDRVWLGTNRGLLQFDGRDLWQVRDAGRVQLGRADTLYDKPPPPASPPPPADRGRWRYLRSANQWQRFQSSSWAAYAGALRTTADPAVQAIAWTDRVSADLGAWDGTTFTPTGPVDATALVMRFKPDETRVVNGGMPAVPRLPPGDSTWRYLAIEPASPVLPTARPAWTIEGRLLPPPADQPTGFAGRFDLIDPDVEGHFDRAAFGFHPAARLWMAWDPAQALSLLVRLRTSAPGETIDPAILDRVWQGIQQVRPAGARAMLAVDEDVVRGRDHGTNP